MRLVAVSSNVLLLLARLAWGSPVEHDRVSEGWGPTTEDTANTTLLAPGERIPGDSTVHHCRNTGQDDLLSIEFIDMSPKVLQRYVSHKGLVASLVRLDGWLIYRDRNKEVTVKFSGWLYQPILEGALVEISVKYLMIPVKIINRKDYLCNLLKEIGLSCPIKPGELSFTKSAPIPNRFIPPVRCSFSLASMFNS